MKNYLNRMAVMTLALTLAVCVPLAVGAEEGIEDVTVQAEDMILVDAEAENEEFVEEIPVVPASVRVSPINLGRCEYFGDTLSLRANLENADGSETLTWQMCTNYVAGGGNAWTQFGSGSTASVKITPAIGQRAYRCVLSTGAVSNVYRVSKTFVEKPEETKEKIEIASEKDAETVVEVQAESEDTNVKNPNTEEVLTHEIGSEKTENEKVEFEESFEDELEFEDEEWLEFDDNDWGESDSNFFAALDDLANSNNEEDTEKAENKIAEDTAEEIVEVVETDVVTVEAVAEEKANDEVPVDEPTEEEISGDNNETEAENNDSFVEEKTEELSTEVEIEENTEEQVAETETEENTEEQIAETETEENIEEQVAETETEETAESLAIGEEETEEVIETVFAGETPEEESKNPDDEEITDTDMDEETSEIVFEFVDMTEETTETESENDEATEDEITEDAVTTEEAEQVEIDPMDLINSDRNVAVSFQWESENHVFGEKVLARATLNGYENVIYKLQWQHSKDGVNYTDVSGATGETLEFVVTEDNYMDYWQVKVVIVAVVNENENM